MDPERANIASDLFIQRADQMTNIPQIESFLLEMIRFYATEVASLEHRQVGSKRVTEALDYIDGHLYQRVTEDEIAESIGLSRAYFATLIKKETGMSVSACIRQRKIREAESLLRSTDMTASEISQLLSFSSQSHFVRVFREETGMTPKRFRESLG